MLQSEQYLYNLKKEMDARKLEKKYDYILGSIVYHPSQKELNDEIQQTNLETIDMGEKLIDKKKESILDTLTKLIGDYPQNEKGEIIPKVKRNQREYDLKINTDLYDFEIDEIDYEKNIYLKKYKQCSPIKRNSFKKKVAFSENEETRL
jgi:hypothetical protein